MCNFEPFRYLVSAILYEFFFLGGGRTTGTRWFWFDSFSYIESEISLIFLIIKFSESFYLQKHFKKFNLNNNKKKTRIGDKEWSESFLLNLSLKLFWNSNLKKKSKNLFLPSKSRVTSKSSLLQISYYESLPKLSFI